MATGGAVDFFQYQDQARRKTSVLVGYYILAVILIILAVYVAVAGLYIAGTEQSTRGSGTTDVSLWNPTLFMVVAGATLLIVVLGSLFKIAQLSGGGANVATMLGGVPINQGTRDPDERKILNVVEEMAIASGTPVPRVFILNDEEGINAFAAGFGTKDAVIGVTRGCIQSLNRDELQGVVAHEFSHILNGDMRLNIRLMGVLFGILAIAFIGRILLRTRGKKNPLPMLGLALMIIGYVGVFFGNLIKSAVSRQREYLADASAVQYTRNPWGISGALKKIGGFAGGSKLVSPKAEEASHLFFASSLSGAFMNLLATHPPLVERIKRLDPAFAGDFQAAIDTAERARPAAAPAAAAGVSGFAVQPAQVLARVGAPRQEHLDYAVGVVAAMPPPLIEAARDPQAACAVIYALLLNDDAKPREVQLRHIETHGGAEAKSLTLRLYDAVKAMPQEYRLPLSEIAVSAMRGLTAAQYGDFCENTVYLVEADEEVDLFEYTLQRMIVRRLEPVFHKTKPAAVQFHDISPLLPYCAELLSCLAYWGADEKSAAEKAFIKGAERLGTGVSLRIAPTHACGLKMLDEALDNLVDASPAIKRRIIDAVVTCATIDGEITLEEAELLRVIADALDCPIPPFIPGQKV